MCRTALLGFLALATACVPATPMMTPPRTDHPAAPRWAFREWLPGALPGIIEGWVTVTEVGLQVTANQAVCTPLSDHPESAMVRFSCAGTTLSFIRNDPTRLALYSATVTVSESRSVCMAPSWGPGGGVTCGYRQTVDVGRREVRGGRLRLVPAT
jgi:hypothetical protein